MTKDKKALHGEYMRERRRIQQFLRRAKNRGYVFEDDILPNIPKNITEGSIRRLQKLTPKELYEKSQYYSWDETTKETLPSGHVIETMNLIPGLRGRGEERRRAVQKAQQTLGHKRAEREKRERQRILDAIYGNDNTPPNSPTGDGITDFGISHTDYGTESNAETEYPNTDYAIDNGETAETEYGVSTSGTYVYDTGEYATASDAESTDEQGYYESTESDVKIESTDSDDYDDIFTTPAEKIESTDSDEYAEYYDDDIFSTPNFEIVDEKPKAMTYSSSSADNNEDADEEIPEESDIGLHTLMDMISKWQPKPNWTPSLEKLKEQDARTAADVINNAIDEVGLDQVIRNAKKHGNELQPLLDEILYGSGSKEGNFKNGRTEVNFDIQKFQALLIDRALTVDEAKALSDLIEANRNE